MPSEADVEAYEQWLEEEAEAHQKKYPELEHKGHHTDLPDECLAVL